MCKGLIDVGFRFTQPDLHSITGTSNPAIPSDVKWRKWRVNAMPTPNTARLLKAIAYPSAHDRVLQLSDRRRGVRPRRHAPLQRVRDFEVAQPVHQACEEGQGRCKREMAANMQEPFKNNKW